MHWSLCLVVIISSFLVGCVPSAKSPAQRNSATTPVNKTVLSERLETGRQELMQRAVERKLERVAIDLGSLAESSILLTLEKADQRQMDLGASKVGGQPDLPASTEWPRWNGVPLAFIAQLRMADAAKYDTEGQLPSTGTLYFFYDVKQRTWGFDPKDRGSWRVIYVADDNAQLQRTEPPADLPKEGRFSACSVGFCVDLTLPAFDTHYVRRLQLSEKERDEYVKLEAELQGERPAINRLLGHPDPIQNEMQLECQLTSNGLYTGNASGWDDPRRKELEKGAADWQLLLQIDSEDDKTGMMWGDCGRLYFWIRKQDLQKRDFGKVWMILQCS